MVYGGIKLSFQMEGKKCKICNGTGIIKEKDKGKTFIINCPRCDGSGVEL